MTFRCGRNRIVYKVAMKRTNIKSTFTAHDTCEMVNKGKVASIKVTSVYFVSFFSLQPNFNRILIEIGLWGHFFLPLANIVSFHLLRSLLSEKLNGLPIVNKSAKKMCKI